MDEHVKGSLAAGADRHISKPVRAMELLDAIASLIFTAPDVEHGDAEDAAAA